MRPIGTGPPETLHPPSTSDGGLCPAMLLTESAAMRSSMLSVTVSRQHRCIWFYLKIAHRCRNKPNRNSPPKTAVTGLHGWLPLTFWRQRGSFTFFLLAALQRLLRRSVAQHLRRSCVRGGTRNMLGGRPFSARPPLTASLRPRASSVTPLRNTHLMVDSDPLRRRTRNGERACIFGSSWQVC